MGNLALGPLFYTEVKMEERIKQIWDRLITGTSLGSLCLSKINDRIDLRGIVTPEPSVGHEKKTAFFNIKKYSNIIEIRGVNWKGLDFSKSRLNSLRIFDSRIEDCCFEESQCRDWRMWGTTILNTSFRSADFRGSALGGVNEGHRNSFINIDFSKADLRNTVYQSADMIGCAFVNTKLRKVNFEGTIFRDCKFEGMLDEVQFYPHAFRGESYPPNEMQNVDFSLAKLRFVEFRGLDMDTVKWPQNDKHIIVDNYPQTLDRILTTLKERSDNVSKRLTAIFGSKRKWCGPNQKRGVISKIDLIEAGGEEAVKEVQDLIKRI